MVDVSIVAVTPFVDLSDPAAKVPTNLVTYRTVPLGEVATFRLAPGALNFPSFEEALQVAVQDRFGHPTVEVVNREAVERMLEAAAEA